MYDKGSPVYFFDTAIVPARFVEMTQPPRPTEEMYFRITGQEMPKKRVRTHLRALELKEGQ